MKKVYTKITKQIGFSYLSTIILFIISPFLVVLLTRNLSVAQYGIYAILAVTVNVAGVLLDLGLSQYIMSRLAGIPSKQRTRAFLTVTTFIMVFLLFVFAIILFTPLEGIILGLLKLKEYVPEFRIGLAIILCVTLVRLFASYLTAKKHIITVNIIWLLSQSLWVLLLIGFFAITKKISLISVMTWWFVGVLITFLVCGFMIRREFSHIHEKTTWNPKIIFEGLLFSLPLLIFITGAWAIEVGNRYMLNSIIGSEAVGLFTLIYSLLGVIAQLGTVVAQTFFPYIASAWNQRKNYQLYLNASAKYSLMIIIPSMAGLLALRKEIVTLVSGAQYLGAANIIPWLLMYPLLSLLNYILYQVVLLRKRTVLIGTTYGIGAVLSIALNLLLIPRLGIAGAAAATVASYALIFVVLVWDARRFLHADYGFLKLERMLLAAAVMGIAVWLIHPTTAPFKILTMLGGAVLYFIILFATRTFSAQEFSLSLSILPKTLQKAAYVIIRPEPKK